MSVYILLEVTETHNHIVGVFKSNRAAVFYAEKFKIKSWHIQTHSVHGLKQVKKM